MEVAGANTTTAWHVTISTAELHKRILALTRPSSADVPPDDVCHRWHYQLKSRGGELLQHDRPDDSWSLVLLELATPCGTTECAVGTRACFSWTMCNRSRIVFQPNTAMPAAEVKQSETQLIVQTTFGCDLCEWYILNLLIIYWAFVFVS